METSESREGLLRGKFDLGLSLVWLGDDCHIECRKIQLIFNSIATKTNMMFSDDKYIHAVKHF